MKRTTQAIQRSLTVDGLVLRYLTHESLDGLPPGEGVFLACSFWLAEEYDPVARRFLGNFPQAFSHVALISTALNLTEAEKPAEQRAESSSGSEPEFAGERY